MTGPRAGWRQELIIVALLSLATLWMARPWATSSVWLFPQRDAAFSAVVLDHLQRALLGQVDWRAAPLGWPYPLGTAQSDWLLGQAVLAMPLRWLDDPLRIYPLSCLMGLWLTAIATHHLSRALSGAGWHTAVAGLAGGLGAVQLSHAHHVNLVHHAILPYAVLALVAGIERDRRWLVFLAGLLAGAAAHFGLYVGLHTIFAVAITALALAWRRQVALTTWAAAAAGLALAGSSLIPVFAMYRQAAAELDAGLGPSEVMSGAWDPLAMWGDATRLDLVWSPMPTLLVAGLLGGAVALRRKPAWTTVALVITAGLAALLALGSNPVIGGTTLNLPGPHALLGLLFDDQLRAPGRWLLLTELALALFAADGLARATARHGRAGAALTGLVGISLVAGAPRTLASLRERVEPEPIYTAVTRHPTPGALLELFGTNTDNSGTPRLLAILQHRRPIVGGNFARFSPRRQAYDRLALRWPDRAATVLLRASGVGLVLVHPGARPGLKRDACQELGPYQICAVGEALTVPEGLSPDGAGPVRALRWTQAPTLETLRVRCEDGQIETVEVAALRILGALLRPDDPELTAPLERPCDWPEVEGPTPELLRALPAASN